jgi:hypothetical protein
VSTLPEVAQLICDWNACQNPGVRYWYYNVVKRPREVILCPDHDVFRNNLLTISRASSDPKPATKRRPTPTRERLEAMFVDDDQDA